MTTDDRYTKHAKLVSKMADKVGLDLLEKMQRGELDSEDLRMMVHRCEGCTDPEDCRHKLESGQITESPPDYCRNAPIFEAMKG
ncbi:MAG: DUF6455 family protein [Paracoccaceae bacterium]|nr:DUF6455 family protein [Paracoccaceae bacterium]MDP7186716.1 DUF6455 family protein [Paracoccaceae bacterium]